MPHRCYGFLHKENRFFRPRNIFSKNLKKPLAFCRMRVIIKHVAEVQHRSESEYADVAELADALDSGSSGSDTVGVQVPSSAPESPVKRPGFSLFPFRRMLPCQQAAFQCNIARPKGRAFLFFLNRCGIGVRLARAVNPVRSACTPAPRPTPTGSPHRCSSLAGTHLALLCSAPGNWFRPR